MTHKPVLLKEILEIFSPKSGQNYIDATINGGGHAEAILEQISPSGKLLGIDWDGELIQKLKSRKQSDKNLILECDNYANLGHLVTKHNFGPIAGILVDLGFSSHHLEESGRGFSFLKDEPLDMRYSPQTHELTAEKIINTWSREAIEDILRRFGEERYARRIADGILYARGVKKIVATGELVEIVRKSVPRAYGREKIHPVTRTFQALRIAVNQELDNLAGALPEMMRLLSPQGKIAVISFHSLEDRIVKNVFKEYAKKELIRIITPKPIVASPQEKRENPRARSAKLRVAQKL